MSIASRTLLGTITHSFFVVAAACSCVRDAASDPVGPQNPVVPRPPTHEDVDLRPVRRSLPRFESEGAFRSWIAQTIRRIEERQRAERRGRSGGVLPAPTPAAPQAEAAQPADGDAGGADSITNNQEVGVDEGDIVKAHGDQLVVLRRGRLFTIDLRDGARRAISRIDLAPAPSGSTSGVWYDEMLVQDDTVVVVGYSYESDGTELVLFRIDRAGILTPRARFHLRSNDYYSSRNYASRLVGGRLVFYMPYSLLRWRYDRSSHLEPSLPAVRFAQLGTDHDDWREIVVATDIVRPVQPTTFPILHTVVSCDLEPAVSCRARGIVGPWGRNFYVSADAVYVWVDGSAALDDDPSDRPVPVSDAPRSAVYRLPLDPNGEVTALRVSGSPTDQFSFRQRGGSLDVLVRAGSGQGGDWMWSPEVRAGEVALVRMPLAWFEEGIFTVPAHAYARLETPRGQSMQNRFVGDFVLYGTGGGWWGPAENADRRIFAHPVGGGPTTIVNLPHGVDRIEPMGSAAVVVGSDGRDLHFTSLDLDGTPRVADRLVQAGATQGETRSHGFFYAPSSDDEGILGLPVRRGDSEGWEHLVEGSAEVLFLRVRSEHFERLGALRSGRVATNDACRVSCVDWYGNARPIFYRGRIFALLGYELVEGRLDTSTVTELGRTNFLFPG